VDQPLHPEIPNQHYYIPTIDKYRLTSRILAIHTFRGHIYQSNSYTSNRSHGQYLSWFSRPQILKYFPDFHETRHERYAIQGHPKTTTVNLLLSVTETRCTSKLARWKTTVGINFERHTTAHPIAHLPPHWGSTRRDWAIVRLFS
jgi:hypothetical protein